MDIKSILGYSLGSPFSNNPYLDINTPNGNITMENTPIDLLGIDNLGNIKKMKAGRKNPYKFKGNMVREIPMQYGGLNIDSTLNANKNIPFVDRILNPEKYPVRPNKDGTVSTHLMAQADNIAYPTLRLVNGKWIENKNPSAAIKAGDFIEFKNPEDALYFTEHYKESKLAKLPKQQYGGQHPPIYTSDKNDPRLRAYQDSLQVYNAMVLQNRLMGNEREDIKAGFKEGKIDIINPVNWTKKDLEERKKMTENIPELKIYNSYNEMMADPNLDKKHKEVVKGYRKLGIPDKNIDFHTSPDLVDTKIKPIANYFDGYAMSPYYKKPVQPVIYQDRPKIDSAQLIPIETPEFMDVQSRKTPYADVNKPVKTNYSFTYRNIDGSQGIKYFPDYNSWNDFMNNNKYSHQEVAGDKSSASATGYTGYNKYGGNPYQKGGNIASQLYNFLFEDDNENDVQIQNSKDIKVLDEKRMQIQQEEDRNRSQLMEIARQRGMMEDEYNYNQAIITALSFDNEYDDSNAGNIGYSDKIGSRGQEIYNQLSSDLGYQFTPNSIFRTQAEQNELIKQGLGVKNSFHLTGDAIDLKPSDWKNLTKQQQQNYRNNYDVVYHNNHYHIEPKTR